MDAHRMEMSRLKQEHAENVEFLKTEYSAEAELLVRKAKEDCSKKVALVTDKLLN